jgi:hypothetical protein
MGRRLRQYLKGSVHGSATTMVTTCCGIRAPNIFFVLNVSLAVILALFLSVFLIPGDRLISATTRAVFAPLVLAEIALMIFANWQLMAGRFRLAETVVTIANLSAALGAVFLTGGAPGSVALPALLIPACTSFLLSGAALGLRVSIFVAVTIGVQIIASTWFGLVLPDYTSPISPGSVPERTCYSLTSRCFRG